jgi:hypothetical protein
MGARPEHANLATRILVLVLSCVLFSCSIGRRNSGGALVKECILPPEQSGTISGKWNATPIPVAFHSGDFSPAEMAEMANSAGTWNGFYKASMGLLPIDFGAGTGGYYTSAATRPTSVCSQSILTGTTFSGPVVIYKMGSWPYPNIPNAIALTSFCPEPGTPPPGQYKPIFMAIMEINYQNFFVAGQKRPDLQSIVLHELGHVLGLNHSCGPASTAGVPGCNESPPEFVDAVMAPVFGFDASGAGEQKRTLTINDQGRANCLYKPSGS